MKRNLFSAPNEEYVVHISKAGETLRRILPTYCKTLERVFSERKEVIEEAFTKMIALHDLGKLTKRWQEKVRNREKTEKDLPISHATLGAATLFKILPRGLGEPLSFAVAIHHTDKGLLGDNIEKPDSQAILDGVVDLDGRVIWHEDAFILDETLFPKEARTLTVYDLRDMALKLRYWAKGESILVRHKRRIQAMLAHHLLKLCDIYSARERLGQVEDEVLFGGWAMTMEIELYVENLLRRSAYYESST